MTYPYFERKCPNCSMVYKEGDLYCSKCGCPLPVAEIKEEELLNGIEKSKWCSYIEKKTERYMPIFENNKNKKTFISPNICAMFFGLHWLFYRKMFKEGLIFTAVNFVLGILLSLLLLVVYQGELKTNVKIIDEFNAYIETIDQNEISELQNSFVIESDKNSVDSQADTYIHSTEYSERYSKALEAQQKIQNIASAISAWGFIINLLLSAAFGLFADCIYRNHIVRRIKNNKVGVAAYENGGASWAFVIVSFLLTFAVNTISGPISEFITGLFIR